LKSFGGQGIAESLGAVLVDFSETNYRPTVALVEEVAISLGLPVPLVYVAADSGINAFSIGQKTEDTVFVLTQGAVERLGREELRAAVVREFCSVLRGEASLRFRILGLLGSFEFLFVVGKSLSHGAWLKTTPLGGLFKLALRVLLFLPGVFLLTLGFTSHICAKLIRLNVGRKAVFFADAAVGRVAGYQLPLVNLLVKASDHPVDSEFSKFEFLSLVPNPRKAKTCIFGWPSVFDRLKKILPGVDIREFTKGQGEVSLSSLAEDKPPTPELLVSAETSAKVLQPKFIEFFQMQPRNLHLKLLACEAFSATAMIHALFIAERNPAVRKLQLDILKKKVPQEMYDYICKKTIRNLWDESLLVRYHVFQIAINTSTHLIYRQKVDLMATVESLIQADGHIDIFELSLLKVLRETLRIEQNPVEHKLSDKHLIRKFLNFYIREMSSAEDYEEIVEQVVHTLGIDLDLSHPVQQAEEAYHLILSLDQMNQTGKRALTQLLHIIGQSSHFRDKERYLALSHIVLNALHVPAAELVEIGSLTGA
jgi:hypothetical protein